MRFLNRLRDALNPTIDITTNTYPVTDAPLTSARTSTFQPDRIMVEHRNGRFHSMAISGRSINNPYVRITRTFDRERDVPAWARGYLNEPQD